MPNSRDYVCAECGEWVRNPFDYAQGRDVFVCNKNPTHQGVKERPHSKRFISGKEIDVSTGREIMPLPKTNEGMRELVLEAGRRGKLGPQRNLSEENYIDLIETALRLQLDPTMGELIILHNAPYITIKARRRLDFEGGRVLKLSQPIPMGPADKILWGFDPKDIVCAMVGTDVNTGSELPGLGIVYHREISAVGIREEGGEEYARSPVVRDNPQNMAIKRCEAQVREKLWGNPFGIKMILGEPEQIVDAEVTELPPKVPIGTQPEPQPDPVPAPGLPQPEPAPREPEPVPAVAETAPVNVPAAEDPVADLYPQSADPPQQPHPPQVSGAAQALAETLQSKIHTIAERYEGYTPLLVQQAWGQAINQGGSARLAEVLDRGVRESELEAILIKYATMTRLKLKAKTRVATRSGPVEPDTGELFP